MHESAEFTVTDAQTKCAEGADKTAADARTDSSPTMPARTVRRNMLCCILMDAIWAMGWADVSMALAPLLVYLQASDQVIGLVNGTMFLAVPGTLLTPFITRRFAFKKWYFFATNIPYLFPLAVAGLTVILSAGMGWNNSALLTIIATLMILHWFFGGFVALPHQEYVVACIPASHRGRLAGFSYSVGSVLGIVSSSIGGMILLRMSKPEAYGVLFLMAWFIMQSGYTFALFAKEQRTPVEKSPKPWSSRMLLAFWRDKNYFRYWITQFLLTVFLGTPMWQFINIYGLKVLGMVPATSAIMLLVFQVVRIVSATPLGALADKVSPKKLYPIWMLVAATVYWPALLLGNGLGVYISIGLSVFYMAGLQTSSTVLSYGLPKPEDRAGHYTITIVMGMVAMSMGPIVVGMLLSTFSYETIFKVISGVAVVLYFVNRFLCRDFPDSFKESP